MLHRVENNQQLLKANEVMRENIFLLAGTPEYEQGQEDYRNDNDCPYADDDSQLRWAFGYRDAEIEDTKNKGESNES